MVIMLFFLAVAAKGHSTDPKWYPWLNSSDRGVIQQGSVANAIPLRGVVTLEGADFGLAARNCI